MPTADVTFADTAGTPRARRVGKVTSVPPPAMELKIPAAMPARTNRAALGAVKTRAEESAVIDTGYEMPAGHLTVYPWLGSGRVEEMPWFV
jgi:hypothetical protein